MSDIFSNVALGRPVDLRLANRQRLLDDPSVSRDDLIEAIALLASTMRRDIQDIACGPGPYASREKLLETIDALKAYSACEVDTIFV